MSNVVNIGLSNSIDKKWKEAKAYLDAGKTKKALVILEALAEAGNKEAYFEIGNIFERSDTEVSQNFETSRYWYMKAVEDYDDPYGYFGLARIALKNHTDAGSLSDAIEYLQYACEREDIPPALTLLGVMYQEGKGLPKDLEQAAKLYEKAIAKGYIAPIIYLSRLNWEKKCFFSSLMLRFKAMREMYKIIKKNPNDPRLWNT